MQDGKKKDGPVDEKALDLPFEWKNMWQLKHDDSCDGYGGKQQNSPEPLEDERNLDEEIAVLQVLDSSTPAHVDTDRVSQKSSQDVIREATEEDKHVRDPYDVFLDEVEESIDLGTVSCKNLRDVSACGEYYNHGDPNLERRQESREQHRIEPSLS